MITDTSPFTSDTSRIDYGDFLTAFTPFLGLWEVDNAAWFYHVTSPSDPLIMLAIAHEEGAGKPDSIAADYSTFNPGNIRNPPPRDVQQIPTRAGLFLKFTDWRDGWLGLAEHINALYRGLTIREAITKWAPPEENNTEQYIAHVVGYMNQWDNGSVETAKGGTMTRVLLAAGHLHIGDITDDRLASGDADRLRNATGALGTEATPNSDVVQTAAAALRGSGVDVTTTDAIYHPDVYAQDYDLAVFVHHDGVGTFREQHAGAAAMRSGNPDADALTVENNFVDAFDRLWPDATGITDTSLLTDNMTGLYNGWYCTPATPRVCVECAIWGADDSGQQEIDTTREGHALAQVISDTLGVQNGQASTGVGNGSEAGADSGKGSNGSEQPDGGTRTVAGNGWTARDIVANGDDRGVTIGFDGNINAYRIGHGFYDEWGGGADTDDAIHAAVTRNGLPLTNEFVISTPGQPPRVTQVFERCVMQWTPDDGVTFVDVGRSWRDAHRTLLPPDTYWG